jgi:DNA-binding PadR family transcriptional regulator
MARLSTSSYAVLGLLSFARMSGYDLAGVTQRSVAQVWPISKTQVYAELRRLSALGLVEGRHAEGSGGPAKTVFELTRNGERVLDDWLVSDTVVGVRLRAPTVLKLLFGHRTAPEHARAHLGQFRDGVSGRLGELEQLASLLERNPDAVYAWATARFGVRVCDAILRWIDEVTPRLPARPLAIDPRRPEPRKARAVMDSLRGRRQ